MEEILNFVLDLCPEKIDKLMINDYGWRMSFLDVDKKFVFNEIQKFDRVQSIIYFDDKMIKFVVSDENLIMLKNFILESLKIDKIFLILKNCKITSLSLVKSELRMENCQINSLDIKNSQYIIFNNCKINYFMLD